VRKVGILWPLAESDRRTDGERPHSNNPFENWGGWRVKTSRLTHAVQAKGVSEEITPASREEAFALSKAIADRGHSHLAAVPIICFEWLQRPENVLAGHLSWGDIRPADAPRHVRINHHKTGRKVLQPLEDAQDRV
jgi:hypothetical protein